MKAMFWPITCLIQAGSGTNVYKLLGAILLLGSCVVNAHAALTIKVLDQNKRPLANVVLELFPEQANVHLSARIPSTTMKQIDQQFMPHVLAIQKGTNVLFPETDTVRHHVYSFSAAKTFELRIYKADVQRQITFDKPGVVELGCNIHDWMLGYIYVSNSAWFVQTNSLGEAHFTDIPKGQYTYRVWHPRLDKRDILAQRSVSTDPTEITLSHPLLPSYSEFDSVHSLDSKNTYE